MVAEVPGSFCKLLPYILILLLKPKKVIFKVSYKTIWSRSRKNSDLWLRGAGTESNIFGSATLPATQNEEWLDMW